MAPTMKQWLAQTVAAPRKKPIPILSFPSAQLMGITVRQLISSADLQAQGMKRIADRVDAGAAVSLMDLSVEAEAFGARVRFSDHEVPTVIGALVTDEDGAEALSVPPVGAGRTGLYVEAVQKARGLITDRPVFAGVIGPFSLAGRLLGVSEAMILCYEEPELVETVLEKATAFLLDYIAAYKKAGAHGVVMAEPLAGMLSPRLAADFSCPYVRRIVEAAQDENFLVIYHNCGDNVLPMAREIASCGAAAYHFGNAVELAQMLPFFPQDCLVMGNVDPAGQLCGGTPDSVSQAVRALVQSCGHAPNFVLSTGCDVPPQSPWENIDAFFRAALEA